MSSAPPEVGAQEALGEVFFALYPPDDVAEAIADFADRLFETRELSGLRVPRERLHVSLNNLGDLPTPPRAAIGAACAAMSTLQARSFVLAFNRIVSFETKTPRKPLVLTGDEGLIGAVLLHGAIHDTLARAGLARRAERRLMPHLTLSRETAALPERVIEPVTWRVREVSLVRLAWGERRHERLETWRLAA